MPSLVEIGPVVLGKKMKMWKVYRQTDRQTDDRWSEKLTWAFSSGKVKSAMNKVKLSKLFKTDNSHFNFHISFPNRKYSKHCNNQRLKVIIQSIIYLKLYQCHLTWFACKSKTVYINKYKILTGWSTNIKHILFYLKHTNFGSKCASSGIL